MKFYIIILLTCISSFSQAQTYNCSISGEIELEGKWTSFNPAESHDVEVDGKVVEFLGYSTNKNNSPSARLKIVSSGTEDVSLVYLPHKLGGYISSTSSKNSRRISFDHSGVLNFNSVFKVNCYLK